MRYNTIVYVAATLMAVACSQDNVQTVSDIADSRLVTFSADATPNASVTRATASLPEALALSGQGKQLWLMPSVTTTPTAASVTRGTQLNSVTALNNFGVSAFKHAAISDGKTLNEYLSDNHLKPDFFWNMEATKVEGTERFTLTKDYYWPATNETLSFFAYAPYGNAKVTPSDDNTEGPQTVRVQIDTDVKQQADFMTACNSSTAHNDAHNTPSVRLNFAHQLTAVRFVVGKQFLKGYVKSIALKNVYTEGTYTIGGNWVLDELNKGNFTISYNLDRPVEGTKDEEITETDETFFMIPHEFADSDPATIEVVYNDGYTDYTVSASLAGTKWEAGTTVTYAITSNKLTTLQIASIDYPATPAAAADMPAAAQGWQEGNQVGMYVVAADGITLKHKNIPVTYSDGKWVVDHNTADGTIYRLPGETFYFYYPYSTASNNQPVGYPERCPEAEADAETFFEGVITHHPVSTDQSDLDSFLASDLMIAKAADEGHASTIKATMARQVGLAVISLESVSVPETVTYTNNEKTGTSGTPTVFTATSEFNGNTPKQNGNKFYYFTKVGGTTSFNSKPGLEDSWASSLEFNLGKNESQEQTAINGNERKNWDFVNAIWNYSKTGTNTASTIHTFTAPVEGSYTFECWGAQGGRGLADGNLEGIGGKGGYAKGTINLSANNQFFIFIGGKGDDAKISTRVAGGWNGGGMGDHDGQDDEGGGGGGGATDIRVTNGNWNDFTSLLSRIMVAGGGGGAAWNLAGGYGGGLSGGSGLGQTDNTHVGSPGTQESGYKFGQGEDGTRMYTNSGVAGSGSGYWGATASRGAAECESSGPGGSGYVSGMEGCYAVKSSSTSSNVSMDKTTPNHFSGRVFSNASMQNGVNEGNGKARITLTR